MPLEHLSNSKVSAIQHHNAIVEFSYPVMSTVFFCDDIEGQLASAENTVHVRGVMEYSE